MSAGAICRAVPSRYTPLLLAENSQPLANAHCAKSLPLTSVLMMCPVAALIRYV